MWCTFLFHFTIYVCKLRGVAHRRVLHVFCALPTRTRRMCTLKFQLKRRIWSNFLLIYFLFRYINWHIVVLIAFEYMRRLKMLHMHNSLTCNSLTYCFLSDACHFEKIKPWRLSLGVKSIPLGRIARYFPTPSRMQQKIKRQGSPLKGVTVGIISAISRPSWTQNGWYVPNNNLLIRCQFESVCLTAKRSICVLHCPRILSLFESN